MKDDQFVINFFLGLELDSNSRTISDILSFNEQEIENTHDFIQYIFPTIEKSNYNPNAPLISENLKRLFSENVVAQENFCKTCRLFLHFCGFKCLKSNELFTPVYEKSFLSRPSHNLLRISRVLNSLNQIGKKSCSREIFSQIETFNFLYPKVIPTSSYEIWKNTQIDDRNQ